MVNQTELLKTKPCYFKKIHKITTNCLSQQGLDSSEDVDIQQGSILHLLFKLGKLFKLVEGICITRHQAKVVKVLEKKTNSQVLVVFEPLFNIFRFKSNVSIKWKSQISCTIWYMNQFSPTNRTLDLLFVFSLNMAWEYQDNHEEISTSSTNESSFFFGSC